MEFCWCEADPPFVPHRLLRGAHRQTVAAAYLGDNPSYRASRMQIPLADGDQLVVHVDQPRIPVPSRRAVLLVHGLAGCHGSRYMSRIAAKLAEAGYTAHRLDLRGCGAGISLARRSMHAGRIEDIAETLGVLESQHRGAPWTVCGFSLGASMVLKMLGASHLSLPMRLDSAIAVAPPLDLAACSRNLRDGWNWIYDRSFLRNLRRYLKQRRTLVTDLHDVDCPNQPKSLYEFDEIFTAPLGGFRDVEDYYRQSSSLADLTRIAIPTRILFAEDDPLIPAEVYRRAEYSSVTRVFPTQHGGHLGYLANPHPTGDPDWHWMDWRIVQWVRAADTDTFLPAGL